MFHTFEAAKPSAGDRGSSSSGTRKVRAKTRACQSCRRRKTRCDGAVPCGTCKWYRKAAQCSFMAGSDQPSENATKRQATDRVAKSRAIIERLFPRRSLHELADLSREELVQQLPDHFPSNSPGANQNHPSRRDTDEDSQDDARSLEQLQDFPESGTAATSRPQSPTGTNGVTDDINALALSVKRARSYLGVSSVMAVLRIILLLDPDSKAFTNPTTGSHGPKSREVAEATKAQETSPSSIPEAVRQPTMWDEVPAINAYFTYIHPQIPLLDEADFRETYMSRKRQDSRWELLLSSVLAMGSVAANTAEDGVHSVFYSRAREHLNLETFTTVHLETVQALTILGGMYLHYAQQPNIASVLVGATFRMATTLGLHRDYAESGSAAKTPEAAHIVELRRRVWWSLCCLDACNSNFLGRPTLGRLGPGHNTRKPEQPIGQNSDITTLLQECIDHCVISTRMDDYLAERSVLGHETRQELDHAFLRWLNRPSVHSLGSSPDTLAGVTVAMNSMRWRCQSARIFIYRPILLWYAMHRGRMERVSEAKREAILTCRYIAGQLIEDISSSWHLPAPCVMAGWPATWLMYQTSMVPMLSLFCDSDQPDIVATSRQQVELVISTLSALEKWSCTARRSLEVVSRLYNASKAYHARKQQEIENTSPSQLQNLGNSVMTTGEGMPDVGAHETPSTHVSASSWEELMLGGFFDDVSWMNNQDHSGHSVGNDLAFLDYYDV